MTAAQALQDYDTMPFHDDPTPGPNVSRSEYFHTLGVLQGTMDSMVRQFDTFRQDIAARHRDNKEALERLMGDLHRENDRSSVATVERVERLELELGQLRENQASNRGDIDATRRHVALILRIGPWAIPALAYVLSRVHA